MSITVKIGTRGSQLALWQAKQLQSKLIGIDVNSELVIIKTQGDNIQNLSFDKLEGKGFFTKEIEDSLLSGEVDIAVHSLKDLPTSQPEGLVIAGLSERADPRDILLINKKSVDTDRTLDLIAGAKIGTSSLRRKTQILNLVSNIEVKDLRGNVPTRIQKLRDGDYDGIILAAAGVERLDLDVSDLVIKKLHPREFVPAPAQGVIGYQVKESDHALRKEILKLHNTTTALRTNLERKVLQLMEGGCQMPLGVYCEIDNANNYHLFGAYAPSAESPLIRANISSSTHDGLAESMVLKLKNNLN